LLAAVQQTSLAVSDFGGFDATMSDDFTIDVRAYRLSEQLQPFFTALNSFEIDCADHVLVRDCLHPEWAVLRFIQSGAPPIGAVTPEPARPSYPFVVSGPTSRSIDFTLGKSRIWGLGLQPAGWARFVDLPACDLADRIIDGHGNAELALFAPILDLVREAGDPDDTARRINAYLLAQDVPVSPSHQAIVACQQALHDPEIANVEMLVSRLGMGRRSLERLCVRYFGFPPKVLLRRQRFLRSLARFTLEPAKHWSDALDVHYFDHAHFVRDFRSFMGMTPTEYAAAPHPILERIIGQRLVDNGAAAETDLPTVLRYAGQAARVD
jgi:AraC-like DNA-binding protein